MKSPSYMPGLGRSWVQRTVIAVALIVGAYLTFEFGRIQANYNIVDTAAEQRAFESEIMGLENRIIVLKQEIALLETHRDIDREAYQLVEVNLEDLQKKIQESKAD